MAVAKLLKYIDFHAFSTREEAPPDPFLDVLVPKVIPAWKALEARYGKELSAPEKNYLFARFILELTTPFYGEGEPAIHLVACRSLLERVLPAADATQALETVPQSPMDWVANAFDAIEQVGLEGGLNLREQHQTADPASPTTPSTPPLSIEPHKDGNPA